MSPLIELSNCFCAYQEFFRCLVFINKIQCLSFSTPSVQQHLIYKDCSEYYTIGKRSSELYRVTPDPRNSSFEVFCDMETMAGGWTVLQARVDGSTNFTRTWQDYKVGFGNLRREFWLGNDKIHLLTKSKDMILRIDLEDFNKSVITQT